MKRCLVCPVRHLVIAIGEVWGRRSSVVETGKLDICLWSLRLLRTVEETTEARRRQTALAAMAMPILMKAQREWRGTGILPGVMPKCFKTRSAILENGRVSRLIFRAHTTHTAVHLGHVISSMHARRYFVILLYRSGSMVTSVYTPRCR